MMKRITNIFLGAAAAMLLLASCEEFQPVFTGKYPAPEPWKIYTDEEFDANGDGQGDFLSISNLLDIYFGTSTVVDVNGNEVPKAVGDGNAVKVEDDVVIRGVVSTTDQPGNFYKTLYIQDQTGGIEIRIGKNGLYNDYKQGQIIYVKCKGLYLGMYGYKEGSKYGGNGCVSLGHQKNTDDPEKYENSSIEDTYLINSHIFRGKMAEGDDVVTPVEITSESALPDVWAQHGNGNGALIGKFVTIKGLEYGDETFALMYMDPNVDREKSSNRVFLSDQTWEIKTWGLTEERVKYHLEEGHWDECMIGNANDQNYGKVGDSENKAKLLKNAMPASVSQYFTLGGKTVQIRTSGFCKFADVEIDSEVLSKAKTIDATGVLTLYQGKVQLTLISLDYVNVN